MLVLMGGIAVLSSRIVLFRLSGWIWGGLIRTISRLITGVLVLATHGRGRRRRVGEVSTGEIWTNLYPCLRIKGVTDRGCGWKGGPHGRTRLLLRPTI